MAIFTLVPEATIGGRAKRGGLGLALSRPSDFETLEPNKLLHFSNMYGMYIYMCMTESSEIYFLKLVTNS